LTEFLLLLPELFLFVLRLLERGLTGIPMIEKRGV
jgi:hypothetical protein